MGATKQRQNTGLGWALAISCGSQRGPDWEGRGIGKTRQAEEEGSAAGWAGGRAAGGASALTQWSWKFTWSQASGPRVSGPQSEVLV